MQSRIFALAMICFASMARAQLVQVGNPSYFSTYNLQTQCPQQVQWELRSSDIGRAERSSNWHFQSDIMHPLALATHEDFTRSGYDRGHMCPAKDRSHSVYDMMNTFMMSNVAPQAPHVNRSSWLRTENTCRQDALRYGSVSVLALPVFLHRDTTWIGNHHVAVPHAFLKVEWISSTDSVLNTWFIWNK